jgi:hypothetical protein
MYPHQSSTFPAITFLLRELDESGIGGGGGTGTGGDGGSTCGGFLCFLFH